MDIKQKAAMATTLASVNQSITDVDSAVSTNSVPELSELHSLFFQNKKLTLARYQDKWLMPISDWLCCIGYISRDSGHRANVLRQQYGDEVVLACTTVTCKRVRQWASLDVLIACHVKRACMNRYQTFIGWLQNTVLPNLNSIDVLQGTGDISLKEKGQISVLDLMLTSSLGLPLDQENREHISQLAKCLRPLYAEVSDEVFFLDILPLHHTIMRLRLINNARYAQMIKANLHTLSNDELWNELKKELFACYHDAPQNENEEERHQHDDSHDDDASDTKKEA